MNGNIGVDLGYERQNFARKNDIDEDSVHFQIYSDQNLQEVYLGFGPQRYETFS